MKKIIFIVLTFSILLNFSCATDDTCIQTKYVKLTVNFYLANPTDTIISNRIKVMSVDSLSVQGLRFDSITGLYQLVDSILYNNQKRVSTIDLPLNNQINIKRSTFKIRFNTIVDTMTVFHSNINDYLS